MANTDLRVMHALWDDPDFVELSWSAQWLYLLLFSIGDRATVDYDPDRWATYARDLSTGSVKQSLNELFSHGYAAEVDGRIRLERHHGLIHKTVTDRSRAAMPTETKMRVFRRDGFRCKTCLATDSLVLDHVHPWALGGSDHESNLQVLCRSCNSRKGARV